MIFDNKTYDKTYFVFLLMQDKMNMLIVGCLTPVGSSLSECVCVYVGGIPDCILDPLFHCKCLRK